MKFDQMAGHRCRRAPKRHGRSPSLARYSAQRPSPPTNQKSERIPFMQARSHLPLQGTLLRWGGLVTLVIGIVSCMLGMHVIGSMQTAPAPTYASSTGTTSSNGSLPELVPAAVPAAASVAAAPALQPVAYVSDPEVHGQQGNTTACGCSPAGCDTPAASHGDCIPIAGSATPAAPPPSLVLDPARGDATAGLSVPKPADLDSNSPSLTKLSISRT